MPVKDFPPVVVTPEMFRLIDGLDTSRVSRSIVARFTKAVKYDSRSCELGEEMHSRANAWRN
jgi:hypothetical protein